VTGPADRLRAAIARRGPVPFSELVEAALYGPDGFYTTGGGAGRTRDFLTSPELGGAFGAVVAHAIDAAWDDGGRPDPWFVVDAGAATGSLARAVLAAEPRCSPALRYVAVETSPALRAIAATRLPVEATSQLLGPRPPRRDPDDDDAQPQGRSGVGPMVALLEDLPAGPIRGVVVANELLDNLPFDIYQRGREGWEEVRVGSAGPALVEVTVPSAPAISTVLDGLVPAAEPGTRVPWQAKAATWVRNAIDLLERGEVIAIDYARPTAAIAAAGGAGSTPDWLRTYRAGGRGRGPLEDPGEQDITADVAIDQLPQPTRITLQRRWLSDHGIDALASAAAARWRERAAIGDLEAIRARSVGPEVAALTDPLGVGGFTVCEWYARADQR